MKLQELNLQEMRAINGGGLLSGNDSSNSGGLAGGLGIGNLLSIQTYSKDGDEETASSFSLGNGINLSLAGVFDSLRS